MSQNQKNINDNLLGESTTNDSGHENYGNKLNEPTAFKVSLNWRQFYQAQVQMLEAQEKSLKRKLQENQDEFTSMEEKYQKKIADLEMKNQELTEQNEVFEEQLKKINQPDFNETVPNHEMKVQLPLENWHDLLAFVPRTQLGNAVSQIGDHQFAYIIQSFLHDELREITLGKMKIIPPRQNVPSDQPAVEVSPNPATMMPDWPMPGNIKDFKEIELRYVDKYVLDFLGKFQENSLLTNVNVNMHFVCKPSKAPRRFNDANDILPRLILIAPFITSIDSLDSTEVDLFREIYNYDDYDYDNDEDEDDNITIPGDGHKSQLLLMEMMAKTRIVLISWYVHGLSECWEKKMVGFCSWLYTPRDDGKPRMLHSWSSFKKSTDCYSFIERIKKDFKMANHSVSFIIYTSIDQNVNVEDISIENFKTNEKLVIKMKSDNDDSRLLISRYPLNAVKSWIEANESEIYEFNTENVDRKINIWSE